MTRLIDRAGRTAAACAVAVGSLLLGACNVKQELLAPQNPGVIDPGAVANTAAADALWVGTLGRWKASMNGGGNNTEALWNWQALFTDELISGDTFSQRNDADSRSLQTNDAVLTPIYQAAQQTRGRARDAINSLLAFDTSPLGKQHVGEMYMVMGYTEMELGESFCNGIPLGETVNGAPVYTQPLTDADVFKQALARLDTALTFLTATDAATITIKQAVLVTRGRIKVDLGDYAGAAAEVATVPTSFQYTWDYTQTTFDNEWWIMGTSVKRYTLGDSVNIAGQIQNAIPFARLNDARVKVRQLGRAGRRQRHDLHRPGELGSRRSYSAAVGHRCAPDRGRGEAPERYPGDDDDPQHAPHDSADARYFQAGNPVGPRYAGRPDDGDESLLPREGAVAVRARLSHGRSAAPCSPVRPHAGQGVPDRPVRAQWNAVGHVRNAGRVPGSGPRVEQPELPRLPRSEGVISRGVQQ